MFNYWKIKEENFDLKLQVKQLEKEKEALLSDLDGVKSSSSKLQKELDHLKENKEMLKLNKEIMELERKKEQMALRMQVDAMQNEMAERSM